MTTLPSVVHVPFYGGSIDAYEPEKGKVRVLIRHICDTLEIDISGQLQKLKSVDWSGLEKISLPDERGRPQEQQTLPLDRLPMWLASIHVRKVAPHLRDKLRRYQNEAADALALHFFGTTNPGVRPREQPATDPALIAALTMLMNQIQASQVQMATMLQSQQIQLDRLRADMDRRGELDKHPIGSQANPYRVIPPGYETHARFVDECHLNLDARGRRRELPTLKRQIGVKPMYYRCGDADPLHLLFPETALTSWAVGFLNRNPTARDGYLPAIARLLNQPEAN